ncbi:E1-E2 ATPase-domain-containing protein [Tirmania nivea]|nr:E1-E2 ATPase-domain-containing protein [Tirmania nivea]
MAANQRLGVPMISVITSPAAPAQEHDSLSISPAVSPNTLRPRPDPSSYLSAGLAPPSPTASSYTGRDRSISISGSTINQPLLESSSTYVARTEEEDNPFTPDPGQEKLFQQDNNPFAFTRGHLIRFFNPKSLAAYFASGGLEGLERGLQTDLVRGLNDREEELTRKVSFGEATVHVPKRQEFHFRKDSSVSYASTLPVLPIPVQIKDGQPPSQPAVTVNHDTEKLGSLPPPANPFVDRIRVFSVNRLPKKKGKSIWDLAWDAYKDPFILVLTGAAVISLALGIYETVSAKQHDPTGLTPIDWVEGVAIVVAIVIVVVVSAGNDWQKERQFSKLNAKKEDRHIQVVRSGKTQDISVYDLLVGDVVCINQGDLIPADGIIIESNEVKCDESSATGESDQMKKTAGQEVYDRIVANGGSTAGLEKLDPFIISGAKVLEGTGRYLVTAVGQNSSFGKIMMDLRHESDKTPLQIKLEGFAGGITKFGLGSAVLLLLVLTFKFIAGLADNDDTAAAKASTFLDILIVAVTIIVVAVPEGLPLAVTLALAYATTRMLKDNNLVRVLRACETMGNATTVCSDKTGTLTQNKMTVVAGIIGRKTKFADIDMETENIGTTGKLASSRTVLAAFSDQVKELFKASVILNSTATDGRKAENSMARRLRPHCCLSSGIISA